MPEKSYQCGQKEQKAKGALLFPAIPSVIGPKWACELAESQYAMLMWLEAWECHTPDILVQGWAMWYSLCEPRMINQT